MTVCKDIWTLMAVSIYVFYLKINYLFSNQSEYTCELAVLLEIYSMYMIHGRESLDISNFRLFLLLPCLCCYNLLTAWIHRLCLCIHNADKCNNLNCVAHDEKKFKLFKMSANLIRSTGKHIYTHTSSIHKRMGEKKNEL